MTEQKDIACMACTGRMPSACWHRASFQCDVPWACSANTQPGFLSSQCLKQHIIHIACHTLSVITPWVENGNRVFDKTKWLQLKLKRDSNKGTASEVNKKLVMGIISGHHISFMCMTYSRFYGMHARYIDSILVWWFIIVGRAWASSTLIY